jgi:hypothetical protein
LVFSFVKNSTYFTVFFIVRNCCIYQSKKHRVFVGEGAKATLINVDIDGAEHSGVHVRHVISQSPPHALVQATPLIKHSGAVHAGQVAR